jgi:hypothetical protein
MLKAFGAGVLVLILAVTIGFLPFFLSLPRQSLSDYLCWLLTAFAGFLTAQRAPRWKVIMGVSMAAPAAILTAMFNYALAELGRPVDFSGFHGARIVTEIYFVWALLLCGVGAVGSYFWSLRRVRPTTD